jgi:hypothetical protein
MFSANSGAAAGGILFFVSYIPYLFLQPRYDTLSWWAKILACLVSNVAMAFGGQVIGMFEGTGKGNIPGSTLLSRLSFCPSILPTHLDSAHVWMLSVLCRCEGTG